MPLIRHRRARRALAAVLVIVGATLMLMAPSIGPGLLAFGVGIALELAGRVMERRQRP